MIVLKSDIRKIDTLTYDIKFESFVKRYRHSFNKKTLELLYKLKSIITIDEIEALLLTGKLTPQTIGNIENVISVFSQSQVEPICYAAAEKIVRDLTSRANGLEITDNTQRSWNQVQQKAFADMMTDTQVRGLLETAVYVREKARFNSFSERELAKVIKDSAGNHGVDMRASLNHYATLRENGISQTKARELTKKVSDRKARERARTIADDGVKNFYRETEYHTVVEAQRQGIFNGVVKQWSTAEDKNVCPICQKMNNAVVGIEEDFIFPDGTPHRGTDGAHPRCRCAIKYYDREIYELGLVG